MNSPSAPLTGISGRPAIGPTPTTTTITTGCPEPGCRHLSPVTFGLLPTGAGVAIDSFFMRATGDRKWVSTEASITDLDTSATAMKVGDGTTVSFFTIAQ